MTESTTWRMSGSSSACAATPIDRLDSPQGVRLIERCKTALARQGMLNLDGFVKAAVVDAATLLIRAAESGGEFEYRSALRSEADPNYDGVARLLQGKDPEVSVQPLAAGTLNVFAGRNTAHRVTHVLGNKCRMVAVFSYYDKPGVAFSSAERLGFYGKAA